MLVNEDTKPYKHVREKKMYTLCLTPLLLFFFHLDVNLWVGIVLFSVVRDVLDPDVHTALFEECQCLSFEQTPSL